MSKRKTEKKRKSKEFEKDKSKSEDGESVQSKQRTSEVSSTSAPDHPGDLPNLQ